MSHTAPNAPPGGSPTLPSEPALRRRVKAELRKRLRGLRQTTPAEACAERSTHIVSSLEAHPTLVNADAVALFWPMLERHEVDLRALDAWLRARGVRIAYPRHLEPAGIELRFVSDPHMLVDRGHRYLEPDDGAPLVGGDGGELSVLDVVIVPAIAVDPTGYRIGYGGGFYDRLLERAKRSPKRPATIAVAYDFQLLPEVPTTEGDVAVDWIVTDRRVLRATDAG